ncbi:hypothetical protein BDN71DRAFT_1429746 [Pleurotus eryngii]|uniref:Uncharacterized protein n=1 Tax=Pleurotus eryngii TaxID=5323 RepID=A0A9P6D8P2_PLEER|nr:hypothetical protein BDN71DRAFT_1429746 [Pleurotus eryngii]
MPSRPRPEQDSTVIRLAIGADLADDVLRILDVRLYRSTFVYIDCRLGTYTTCTHVASTCAYANGAVEVATPYGRVPTFAGLGRSRFFGPFFPSSSAPPSSWRDATRPTQRDNRPRIAVHVCYIGMRHVYNIVRQRAPSLEIDNKVPKRPINRPLMRLRPILFWGDVFSPLDLRVAPGSGTYNPLSIFRLLELPFCGMKTPGVEKTHGYGYFKDNKSDEKRRQENQFQKAITASSIKQTSVGSRAMAHGKMSIAVESRFGAFWSLQLSAHTEFGYLEAGRSWNASAVIWEGSDIAIVRDTDVPALGASISRMLVAHSNPRQVTTSSKFNNDRIYTYMVQDVNGDSLGVTCEPSYTHTLPNSRDELMSLRFPSIRLGNHQRFHIAGDASRCAGYWLRVFTGRSCPNPEVKDVSDINTHAVYHSLKKLASLYRVRTAANAPNSWGR